MLDIRLNVWDTLLVNGIAGFKATLSAHSVVAVRAWASVGLVRATTVSRLALLLT